jgi:hypothetical protein
MEHEMTLPGWLRQTLIGIGLFIAGAVIAFGYSYRPLHGALNWKVDHLEARLDERNLELQKLNDELSTLRSSEEERVDPETLAQVESELEKTRSALASLEKKHAYAEKKRKEANASARTWRKRFESLQTAQSKSAPAPLPAAPVPVPEEFVRPAPNTVPADRANDFSATTRRDRSPSSASAQSDAFPEATIRSPGTTRAPTRSPQDDPFGGTSQSPGRPERGMLPDDSTSIAP